jgi:hypothetical protein
MAHVKKFNSTYTLDGSDVYVTGNLIVQGNSTSISTTNTDIEDRIITLNKGETLNGIGGNIAPLDVSGFEWDRGTNPLGPAYLFFKEVTDTFVISVDGGASWEQILTTPVAVGNVAGSVITEIVQDTSPQLGANLDVQSFSIFTGNAATNITFAGNLQLNNTAVAPTVVANATVVYAATPAAGTSGVYVVNGLAANEELVTKRRAFGFSLIL